MEIGKNFLWTDVRMDGFFLCYNRNLFPRWTQTNCCSIYHALHSMSQLKCKQVLMHLNTCKNPLHVNINSTYPHTHNKEKNSTNSTNSNSQPEFQSTRSSVGDNLKIESWQPYYECGCPPIIKPAFITQESASSPLWTFFTDVS